MTIMAMSWSQLADVHKIYRTGEMEVHGVRGCFA